VLRVSAPRQTRGNHRYRLVVAPANRDDTAPGLVLANDVRVRGTLRGSCVDAVDLYRYTVRRRSDRALTLRTGGSTAFDLLLMDDKGRRLACACGRTGSQELRRRQGAGRYFVAVLAREGARARYTLRRLSRTITRTTATFRGRRSVTARPATR
jgi:hypothetical protein